MKKILLFDTSVATFNVGDEIINDSIHMNWPELFRDNYICKYPAHTPPYSWWQQLLVPHKFKNLSSVDYKFLCGTNALYTNMIRPLPVWNVYIWNAGFCKNTILLGVGAGINSKYINLYTKILYNKVLSHDLIHSTRDEYTKDMLIKLGFKAVNTGCPTLWGLTPEHCSKIPNTKSKNVVFTLTGKQADVENDRLMIKILQEEYETLYFWPQTISDLDYLKSLGDYKYILVAPNLPSYDKLLDSELDYVGSRLHGGIRALQHKKRSVIISIDYRADNMAKSYSLPVIKRENIATELRSYINGINPTAITGLNWSAIDEWKQQFTI